MGEPGYADLMSDTRAIFTVDTPGFADESFFGAFRRKLAVQLRSDLGEFQSVTVTMALEVTDPDAPPPPVPLTQAEMAHEENMRKVEALGTTLAFLRERQR